MSSVESILSLTDAQIKRGNLKEARAELKPLLTMKLSALQCEKLAELYRRLGLGRIALRVLRPWVVGYGRKLPESSSQAKIEYAASLIQLDLVDEGRKFLNLPGVIRSREAKRWHALSFLYDFQLDKAADEIIPLLKEYDSESYDYLVLKMNLLAALLASVHLPERLKLFKRVSREVKEGIQKHDATRLRGAYESLQVQSVFFAGTEEHLKLTEKEEIQSELDFFKSFAALFHEARAERLNTRVLNREYSLLRELAIQRNWPEALREIDLHYSRIFRPRHLSFVKMGTRYPHYQVRHLNQIQVQKYYCFTRELPLNQEPDLSHAFEITKLPEAGKLRELFQLFYSEQYSSLTPFAIWITLAKGEHFISPHSGNRVHQWVKRLKLWLRKSKIPARIRVTKEGYRFIPERVLSCDSKLMLTQDPDTELLGVLKSRFQVGVYFSIHEISALAPRLTLRELQYRLKNYLENGHLVRTGKARSVRYSRSV